MSKVVVLCYYVMSISFIHSLEHNWSQGSKHLRWTTFYRDAARAGTNSFYSCGVRLKSCCKCARGNSSAAVLGTTSRSVGSIRRPPMVYIYNALKQFKTLDKGGLFIGSVQQVQISESPIFPILHICLTLLLSFFILAVTALPDVIGFTIEKRAFNARTLPAQSPTGVQILSMISFPQARLSVRKWDFTVNRHTYLHSCSR